MPVALPEQIAWEAGVIVKTGFGFTVMVTVIGLPVQLPVVGVTVYTTVPDIVDVVVNVWAMKDPLPADAPDAFTWLTVQL